MADIKKTEECICKWCDKSIKYDPSKKMWYATVKGSTNFYCVKDKNVNRCQHKPLS